MLRGMDGERLGSELEGGVELGTVEAEGPVEVIVAVGPGAEACGVSSSLK